MSDTAAKVLAAAFCMGIGSIAPAIAEGMVASRAMDAISRNPSLGDSLVPKMVLAMAICESTGIYALVISFIILFVA